MRTRNLRVVLLAVGLPVLVAPGAPAVAPAQTRYSPVVTNPWFPLRPGDRWTLRGAEDGHRLREVVRVTADVEVVDGVPCAVVSDRLYRDGRLAERTADWYSQDAAGTVWYFGERTAELDASGRVTSTEGSWRAGVDGARAGVFMPRRPEVGRSYTQEQAPGVAEDRFEVLSLHATIAVPAGTFRRRALKTKEWTPLEPGVRDRKWYVRGIGLVAEATVKGGTERLELVSFHRARSR